MARRPVQFTPMPAVPQQGLNDLQFAILNSLKENVELLIGARGENGLSRRAVTTGDITVSNPPTQQLQRVTAQGVGFTISGVNVPGLEDYVKLISDVQTLANDVANLRQVVDILVSQLKR